MTTVFTKLLASVPRSCFIYIFSWARSNLDLNSRNKCCHPFSLTTHNCHIVSHYHIYWKIACRRLSRKKQHKICFILLIFYALFSCWQCYCCCGTVRYGLKSVVHFACFALSFCGNFACTLCCMSTVSVALVAPRNPNIQATKHKNPANDKAD